MKSELSASTKVLFATVGSQAVTFGLYPVISRLYTPDAFGVYTTFLTLAAFLLPLVTGCYDQALIQTNSKAERAYLVSLIFRRIKICAMVAGVFGLCLLPVPRSFVYWEILSITWLASLLVIFNAVFSTLSEVLVRVGDFNRLALAKFFNGGGSAVARSGLGFVGSSSGYMIAGELLAKATVAAWSFGLLLRREGVLGGVNLKAPLQLESFSSDYSRFPKIILPEQLINLLAGSVHVIVISIFFGMEELGYVALIFSSLYFPVTIVTASLKDVFRNFGSAAFREQGTCRPLFWKFLFILLAIGACIFVPLYLYAELFIVTVFGAQWSQSALYAKIMTPMFFTNFVAMTFSGVMIFTDRLREALYWQLSSLLATVSALLIGAVVYQSVLWTLILFSAARTLSYVSYAVLAFYFSKSHKGLIR